MKGPYGQLTYTSFDDSNAGAGDVVGGWQVKQQGDLDDHERVRALELVSGTMPLVTPLSRFPSAAEIEALPRRLVLDVGDDGVALLVHSTPAGPDASGRPGNVFNHVLLDRHFAERLHTAAPEPATSDSRTTPARPIALWRSPQWLTPFGPDAVRSAEVGDPPLAQGLITSRTVARFLLEPGADRVPGLLVLLDALQARLDAHDLVGDGPCVVLIADDVDQGALWIGAVALLAAPQADVQLTFCTYEPVEDLIEREPRSALTIVLRADSVERLTSTKTYAVIDPRVVPFVPHGQWAALAAAVCRLDEAALADRLECVDELSEANPEAADACAWWPLAVAVAELPELRATCPAAVEVILQRTPRNGPLQEATAVFLDALVLQASGRTADDAWLLLERLGPASEMSEPWLTSTYVSYLRRTLSDPYTLLADPPATALALPPRLSERVLAAVALAVPGPLTRLGEDAVDPTSWAAVVLRWLDLTARVGLSFPDADPALDRVLERLAPLLVGAAGPAVVAAAGQIERPAAELAARAVDQALADSESAPGERLDVAVTAWFAAALPRRVASWSSDRRPLTIELLVHACRTQAEVGQARRVAGARALLDSPDWRTGAHPRERVGDALKSLGRGQPWTPAMIDMLLDEVTSADAIDVTGEACTALLTYGPSADSAQLASRLLGQDWPGGDETERGILRLYQLLAPGWHETAGEDIRMCVKLVGFASRLARSGRVTDKDLRMLAPDLLAAAARAAVWAVGRGAPSNGMRYGSGLGFDGGLLAPLLPDGAEAAAELLGQMMRRQREFASDLFDVLALLHAGPVSGVPLADLLRLPTASGTLGDLALTAYLDTRDDPEQWVNAQLNVTHVPGHDDHIKKWAKNLAARATPAPRLSTTVLPR